MVNAVLVGWVVEYHRACRAGHGTSERSIITFGNKVQVQSIPLAQATPQQIKSHIQSHC
jgi:hypothetical protein